MARILCIDDNRHGRFARQSLLEDQGYEVVVACNGPEGLEKFRGGKVDLVIVDYIMPEMNGAEVIQHIRKSNTRVPIILHSGYSERLALDEKVEGADAVLQKGPREIKELLETIHRLLHRNGRKGPARAAAKARRRTSRR